MTAPIAAVECSLAHTEFVTKENRPENPVEAAFRRYEDVEHFDLKWMDMPSGHRALSRIRRANDLALRYVHRRVDRVDLAFTPHEAADDVLARGLTVPPTDNPPWREVKVWMRMHSDEAVAEVMVADVGVGVSPVPSAAWRVMLDEARRGIYADGTLDVTIASGSKLAIEVGQLRCYLPRDLR
jgi:hypothetical protein